MNLLVGPQAFAASVNLVCTVVGAFRKERREEDDDVYSIPDDEIII